jgi:hypothetical protein
MSGVKSVILVLLRGDAVDSYFRLFVVLPKILLNKQSFHVDQPFQLSKLLERFAARLSCIPGN